MSPHPRPWRTDKPTDRRAPDTEATDPGTWKEPQVDKDLRQLPESTGQAPSPPRPLLNYIFVLCVFRAIVSPVNILNQRASRLPEETERRSRVMCKKTNADGASGAAKGGRVIPVPEAVRLV